jgi:hypothetical protein
MHVYIYIYVCMYATFTYVYYYCIQPQNLRRFLQYICIYMCACSKHVYVHTCMLVARMYVHIYLLLIHRLAPAILIIIEGRKTTFSDFWYEFTTEKPLNDLKLTLSYYDNVSRDEVCVCVCVCVYMLFCICLHGLVSDFTFYSDDMYAYTHTTQTVVMRMT